MIIQNGKYDEILIRSHIQLLKNLVADMEAFLDGKGPTEEIIEQAPVIDLWSFSTRECPSLEGTFHHHPLLGRIVPNGTTSHLWLLNKDEGWAGVWFEEQLTEMCIRSDRYDQELTLLQFEDTGLKYQPEHSIEDIFDNIQNLRSSLKNQNAVCNFE